MDLNLTDTRDSNNFDNNIKNDEKNDEEKEILEKLESGSKTKCNKKILIISISITIIIALIIFLILYFVINKSEIKMEDYQKIRLKNWEFISSEKINISPEQISKGEKTEIFNKAPEDFYVCTPMGGLSGHTNKYYYETELQSVDKTQFDVDWWFRSHFDLELPDSNEALILLHVNGINYKSDIYVDGNLFASKGKIIGTFVKYTLDITNHLDKDSKTHYVALKISRPHNKWNDDPSKEKDLAISFVDWNPDPPDSNMGIWLPVDIEIFNKRRLTVPSVFINTKIIEEKNINLEIILHNKNWEEKRIENNFSIKLGDFIYIKDIKITLDSLEEKQIVLTNETYKNLNIEYDTNKLWWPFQMGKPSIHNLEINFGDYHYTREIGLRQVESEYDSIKK